MGKTKIEWSEAVWNPVTGCDKVSPGCANCYAETFAERWRGVEGHPYEHGFDLQLRPDRLSTPLGWKKPRTIFVNSMSDLFHPDIPPEYLDRVFATMTEAAQHTFQGAHQAPRARRRALRPLGMAAQRVARRQRRRTSAGPRGSTFSAPSPPRCAS